MAIPVSLIVFKTLLYCLPGYLSGQTTCSFITLDSHLTTLFTCHWTTAMLMCLPKVYTDQNLSSQPHRASWAEKTKYECIACLQEWVNLYKPSPQVYYMNNNINLLHQSFSISQLHELLFTISQLHKSFSIMGYDSLTIYPPHKAFSTSLLHESLYISLLNKLLSISLLHELLSISLLQESLSISLLKQSLSISLLHYSLSFYLTGQLPCC